MATSRISETVYDGRDNVLALVILADEEPIADLSYLTRAVLTCGGVAMDSDTADPGIVWWTDQVTYEGSLVDVLKMRLGLVGIPLGTYLDACLVLFDSANTDGLVYSNNIKLKVVAGCSLV